ncbi:hypothetical protein ACJZ2D_015873 [Fusarium nematophilum]
MDRDGSTEINPLQLTRWIFGQPLVRTWYPCRASARACSLVTGHVLVMEGGEELQGSRSIGPGKGGSQPGAGHGGKEVEAFFLSTVHSAKAKTVSFEFDGI